MTDSGKDEGDVQATPARVYDVWLGGNGNTAADRQQAAVVDQAYETARTVARENRAFVCRAVTFIAEQRIGQFIDLGAGLAATSPSVHECAREVNPDARVIYADSDEAVAMQSAGDLYSVPDVAAIIADLTKPSDLLAHPELTALADVTQPVGLIVTSTLHFMPVEKARIAMARFRDLLAPGSWLALSVGTGIQDAVDDFNRRYQAGRVYLHTPDDIRGYLGDWEIAEPGLVEARAWRAESTGPGRVGTILAAVARKP